MYKMYDINMDMKAGYPIKTVGHNLAGLWRPSFVKVDQQLYVFGGGGNVTDDLHYLDLLQMRWKTIENPIGKAPSKRYGHSATRWKDTIIIFGGCNEFQEYCSDVHIFNMKTMTWYQPSLKGVVAPRYLHTATVFQNKLYVYGGFAKSSDCTYVLDELCVLDLKTMTWFEYHDMPPRYNHSATMIGNKMYIYAGKDEQGNTVSDLFMINLMKMPYIPHLVLNASQPSNENMVLLKSQHFCDTACGKLLMFGRYLINNKGSDHTNTSHKNTATESQNSSDSTYSLWMLDLDSLQWERQECGGHFDIGGWNYFTIINEHSGLDVDVQTEISINNLLFLGNTDPYRPQGYDHFRDALLIHGESLGLYDITEPTCSSEFIQLLDNQELSDFTIVTTEGRAIHAHQVILLTRWTYFSQLLKTGRVKTEKELIIPEHYDVVILFLKFLYSDCLDEAASWQTICRLLVLSNHYKVHRLKKLCCQRLYKYHMSVDSCGVIFEKALQAEEMGLKSLTLNYMFENYGSILKTNILLSLSPSTRDAFLESVPEGAKLDIHRSKWTANRDHASMLDNQHNTNTNTIISVTPINHHSTSITHALYNSSRHHSQSTHLGINASNDYFISPNVTSTATSMANNHHANISHIPDYPQNRRTDMLTNHDLIPISSTSANNTTDSMIVEV